MRKIFLSLMALCLMATSAMAYDQAVEDQPYYGSNCAAYGLADGTVAVTTYYLPTDYTEMWIPTTIQVWENEVMTAEYEVSQVGYSTWGAVYVEQNSAQANNVVTAVHIAEGVKTINSATFASWADEAEKNFSALAALELPSTLTSIGDYAFTNCDALTTIVCNATTAPTVGTDAFKGTSGWDAIAKNCKVYVPYPAATNYYITDSWPIWTTFYNAGNVIDTYTENGFRGRRLADGTVYIDAYIGAEEPDLKFPATVDGMTVSRIGDGSYSVYIQFGESESKASVTDITVPYGPAVAAKAFENFTGARTFTMKGTAAIGEYAFYNDGALEEIWFAREDDPVVLPAITSNSFKYSESEWNKIYNQATVYVLNKDIMDAMFADTEGWNLFAKKSYHKFTLHDDADPVEDKSWYNGKYVTVKTNRTFTAGHWHTICFPFSIDNWNLKNVFGEGVELAYLVSSNLVGEDLYLNFGTDATYTNACTPYLIKPSQDVAAEAEFAGVWYSEALNKTAHTDYADFIGSFAPVVLTADQYFMGNDDNLYTNAGVTMNGFRAYFEFGENVPAAARRRIVMQGQEVTGIEDVMEQNQSTKVLENGQLFIIKNGVRYNAQGQIVK